MAAAAAKANLLLLKWKSWQNIMTNIDINYH
jgi:hypothetical protein